MRFVDTSFWIGLQVPKDSRHADALRFQDALHKSDIVTVRVDAATTTP